MMLLLQSCSHSGRFSGRLGTEFDDEAGNFPLKMLNFDYRPAQDQQPRTKARHIPRFDSLRLAILQ